MNEDHSSAAIAERLRHIEALLEERGLLDDGEIDRRIDEFLAGGSLTNGARITAHAWVDPEFRERLLADGNAALRELGLSMAGALQSSG
jgi:nitrile hydratase